jgi:hypothetical protein
MYYHSSAQRDLIESLAKVVCPPSPSPAELAGEIAHSTQMAMRAFPGPARLALIAGMRTYDQAARLFLGAGGKPARQLDPEVGGRYFASWWSSRLGVQRNFAKGIKGIICLSYYELPAVKEAIGYIPERWIEAVTARRLSIYKVDIDNHAARLIAPDPLGGFPLEPS